MLDEIEAQAALRPATKAVHAGEIADRTFGRPVTQPIYPTTVFSFKDLDELDTTVEQPGEGWYYYRYGSPNRLAFEQAMAQLENAEAALATGSGMGAIFAALSAVLRTGDHIVADSNIYGGSYSLFVEAFPRFGITTTLVDFADLEQVRQAIRPETRVLYFETLTNPLLQVTDLEAAVALAREHNLLTFVDATFSTPIVCRPLEWGADVVLHATTKYIGGHSDALGGIVAGSKELVAATTKMASTVGLAQSSFDAWLNVRSLKTLPLRMTAHSRNALAVARWLENHSKVKRVLYPGLASHAQHKVAQRLMPEGLYGGMLSFEVNGGRDFVNQFIRNLKQIPLVPSLADVMTTFSHPASTSHRMLTAEQRKSFGITEGLLRLSVGVEDVNDILEDLDQAFSKV